MPYYMKLFPLFILHYPNYVHSGLLIVIKGKYKWTLLYYNNIYIYVYWGYEAQDPAAVVLGAKRTPHKWCSFSSCTRPTQTCRIRRAARARVKGWGFIGFGVS